MKRCIKCGEEKEFSEFPKRKDSPDGHRNTCKQCRLEYQRKWVAGEIHKKDYNTQDGMKICRKCNRELSIDNFGKSKQNKDGLKSYCKECKKKESAAWREKNKDYGKEYREKHRDKLREKDREYYRNNREKRAENKKRYVKKNYDAEQKRKKDWYNNNRERILKNKKERYYNNREEIIAREIERRKNSIQETLRHNLRTRLRQAIKNKTKVGSVVTDLGCTICELKLYLESKFHDGMTWDNYGKYGWHIDHIIPLSSFDLTDRSQFLKACHYTNLQPLWAEDNLKKGAKMPEDK